MVGDLKLRHDPKTGDWYVLKKFMDMNCRLRWEIESTHRYRSEALARKKELEGNAIR